MLSRNYNKNILFSSGNEEFEKSCTLRWSHFTDNNATRKSNCLANMFVHMC